MAISRDTLWRTAGDIPMETWKRVIDSAGGPEGLVRPEAWASARPHSALALAMLKQESSYATDFAANPASNRNPWNLKIPTGGGYVAYPTWAAGVAGWRERLTSETYKSGIYHNTKTIADLVNVYAPSYDQTKTTTEKYIDTIVGLMNGWGPVSVPPGEDEIPMALTIRRGIIPAGRRNRPGTKLNDGGLWLVTHDTGNPGRGADAEMHRQFVHNPATAVSFHFTVDDKEAIQLLPLDEIGYHAGDGCNNRSTDRGCFAGVATELCINSDGNWWAAYANLKDLYAAIITGDSRIDFGGRKGDFSAERITTHQKVSDDNKYCPRTVLEKGLVPDIVAGVTNRVTAIRDGTTPEPDPEPQPDPTPDPQYAPPIAIAELHGLEKMDPNIIAAIVSTEGTEFIYVNDRVRAIRNTPRRQRAADKSKLIGPIIAAGSEFTVSWIFTAKDGRAFYLTPFWTRILASDTERVRDAA